MLSNAIKWTKKGHSGSPWPHQSGTRLMPKLAKISQNDSEEQNRRFFNNFEHIWGAIIRKNEARVGRGTPWYNEGRGPARAKAAPPESKNEEPGEGTPWYNEGRGPPRAKPAGAHLGTMRAASPCRPRRQGHTLVQRGPESLCGPWRLGPGLPFI